MLLKMLVFKRSQEELQSRWKSLSKRTKKLEIIKSKKEKLMINLLFFLHKVQ